ncbi:MAG: thioredoxin family protein [Desulfobaccales bacterium]
MMGAINWRDNWPSALEEAKKENRRVLLELYMDGCPHCTHLHNETHIDAGVVQELNSKYIPVKLEGRSHMDIVKQFNVTGAPTTLVFDSDGKELHRFPGYYSPLEYLKELEKAL